VPESSWPSPSAGRVVDDTQYEKIGIGLGAYGGVIGDFTSPQLVYGDSTGRQIKVAADRHALVRGHTWYSGSTVTTVAIAANASGSTRVDLVVLRLSRTTWDVTLTVVAGTPGAGAPAPTQGLGTTGSWDLPLATVSVASGASTITAGNVTYVGPHLDTGGGGLRVASTAGLAYIPQPAAGMRAALADASRYVYKSSAWVPVAGPGAPYLIVEKTTGFPASIPTGSTWTSILWTATRFTTDASMWSSGTAGRLIAPVAGWYVVTGVATWDTVGGLTSAFISVLKNATTTERYRGSSLGKTVGGDSQTVTAELQMAAGDYVEIQVICVGAAGSLVKFERAPWASLRYLRPVSG
jgi:hypothetical protein